MDSPIDLPPVSFIAESSKETLQEIRAKSFERACILTKHKQEIEGEILKARSLAEIADWFIKNREGVIDILGARALGEVPELFRSVAKPQSVGLQSHASEAA